MTYRFFPSPRVVEVKRAYCGVYNFFFFYFLFLFLPYRHILNVYSTKHYYSGVYNIVFVVTTLNLE